MKYILYELISNGFDAFLSDRVGSLQVEMSGPKVLGLLYSWVGKAPGSQCLSHGHSLFIHPGVKVMFSKHVGHVLGNGQG